MCNVNESRYIIHVNCINIIIYNVMGIVILKDTGLYGHKNEK